LAHSENAPCLKNAKARQKRDKSVTKICRAFVIGQMKFNGTFSDMQFFSLIAFSRSPQQIIARLAVSLRACGLAAAATDGIGNCATRRESVDTCHIAGISFAPCLGVKARFYALFYTVGNGDGIGIAAQSLRRFLFKRGIRNGICAGLVADKGSDRTSGDDSGQNDEVNQFTHGLLSVCVGAVSFCGRKQSEHRARRRSLCTFQKPLGPASHPRLVR
jgi:hypothetical protein